MQNYCSIMALGSLTPRLLRTRWSIAILVPWSRPRTGLGLRWLSAIRFPSARARISPIHISLISAVYPGVIVTGHQFNNSGPARLVVGISRSGLSHQRYPGAPRAPIRRPISVNLGLGDAEQPTRSRRLRWWDGGQLALLPFPDQRRASVAYLCTQLPWQSLASLQEVKGPSLVAGDPV